MIFNRSRKSTNDKSRNGIQRKLLSVVLLPIILLGFLIITLGMVLLYRSYVQNIREELVSTTGVWMDSMELTVQGDYSYENRRLLKGNINITDSDMLYRIKENAQTDMTIFWQDTRVLTTVKDDYGILAVGTKASPEVLENVLEKGEQYFSNNVDVNGIHYIGYYTPLINSDDTVVGMVFAGKQQRQAFEKMARMLSWFFVFSALAVLIAVFVTKHFSKKMVEDINGINGFLKTLSEGDLTVTLDEEIVERNDELGNIGRYASKMRKDLKRMIERDPLTSLYNRRSCKNRLNVLRTQKEAYSVVMCDIDWFKRVNDNYGHEAGDYLLMAIAQMIKENIKGCGFACRWGGEEFLLIYQLDFEETKEKVEQLQKQIREYDFEYEGKQLKLTMTFGIEAEDGEDSYEERIKRADNKLYDGKNNGRNQIVC